MLPRQFKLIQSLFKTDYLREVMGLNTLRWKQTASSNYCINNVTERLLNKRLFHLFILHVKSKQPQQAKNLTMWICAWCGLSTPTKQLPWTFQLRTVNGFTWNKCLNCSSCCTLSVHKSKIQHTLKIQIRTKEEPCDFRHSWVRQQPCELWLHFLT